MCFTFVKFLDQYSETWSTASCPTPLFKAIGNAISEGFSLRKYIACTMEAHPTKVHSGFCPVMCGCAQPRPIPTVHDCTFSTLNPIFFPPGRRTVTPCIRQSWPSWWGWKSTLVFSIEEASGRGRNCQSFRTKDDQSPIVTVSISSTLSWQSQRKTPPPGNWTSSQLPQFQHLLPRLLSNLQIKLWMEFKKRNLGNYKSGYQAFG